MFSCISRARFLIWLKQAYKLYNASSLQQELTPSSKPFCYVLMIKQALKKHGTKENHAIDAKKIVFLKDKFIYYSYSY